MQPKKDLALIATVALLLMLLAFTGQGEARYIHPMSIDNFGFVRDNNMAFFPTRQQAVKTPSYAVEPYGETSPQDSSQKRSEDFPVEEADVDYDYDYQPRVGAIKQRSEIRRENKLKELYEKIAREFPFLAKQGLKQHGRKVPSLDEMLAMTIFSQPRAG